MISSPLVICWIRVKHGLPHLTLAFLGQFQVSLDGRPVTAFETDKARALLAYLAMETGRAHTRSALAGLLWPGYTEASARTSLRHVLHKLRQTIDDATNTPPFLLITRQTIGFNPAAAHTLDVTRFTTLLQQCATHAHAQLNQCPLCLARLADAVALCRGEFLAGITVQDSAEFEEWRRIEQEQLHISLMESLQLLADAYEAMHDYATARRYSQRQVELEPWREDTHLQLMRLLARSGQRSAAIAQYHTCRQLLATELGIEPNAAITELYEQIRRGTLPELEQTNPAIPDRATLESAAPDRAAPDHIVNGQNLAAAHTPPLASQSPRHNLPEPMTSFIGREADLAELDRRLRNPAVRLLTLVGTGGMGKTRLAIAAARARLNTADTNPSATFPDGFFFVPLTSLTQATELVPAIATAMGLPLRGDDVAQTLIRLLQPRRLLLILDNCEHLLDGMSFIAELLQSAPQVQIIATSRERLNLQAEHLYWVDGLEVVATERFVEAAQASAVRLFVQSAQRVQPNFKLTEANIATVLKICALVQGMPLGIEWAAAWTDTLSLEVIAAEIAHSADFLAVDWRDLPERQRSMRAVFDWSWELLNDTERAALRRLSVFRGGFTREAAQSVMGASLRVLTRLVHKSLLRWDQESNLTTRYAVHELVRQFAAEQLAALPEESHEIQAQHSHFYLAYVVERWPRLAYHEPRQASHEIRVEYNNVYQAWQWAAANRRLAALEQCAEALWFFFALANLADGAAILGVAADSARQTMLLADGDAEQRAAQRQLSKFLALQANLVPDGPNKFEQSVALVQQVMAIDVNGADREAKIFANWVWAAGCFRKGEIAEAQARLEQVISWIAESATPTSELQKMTHWLALVWLGGVYSIRGDYTLAKQIMQQALDDCQRLGMLYGEMICLVNLGSVELEAGNYGAARHSHEQALPLIHLTGYRWSEGATLIDLGKSVRMLGEYGLAESLLTRGQAILYSIGELTEPVWALIALAELDVYLGNYARAQLRLDQIAQSLSMSTATALLNVEYTLALALLAHATGDFTQALLQATRGWQIASESSNRTRQAQALVFIGHAQASLQQPTEAHNAYQQALLLYTDLGRMPAAAEAKAGLAALAATQGAVACALAYVEEILAILTDEPLVGVDEPFYTYLTCYEILSVQQDARAGALLQAAHDLLQTYAGHIGDDQLRQSFLANVVIHRALQHAYRAYLDAALGNNATVQAEVTPIAS